MNIEDLLGYARRTGMFWPAGEIYGGSAGLYDYGHIGAMLKRRFENLWLSYFVERNQNYFLIDGTTLLPEKPLVASGHAERFNDILIACKKCKTYYRADVLLSDLGVQLNEGATSVEVDEAVSANDLKCPKCGGPLGEAKAFNMMIDVALGPDRSDHGYLRPETAQSAYLNFYREYNLLRQKLPLGLAIIGRAYRNEISPRQGLYRLRELIQAELQIFFDEQAFKPDLSSLSRTMINVVPYETGKLESMTPDDLVSRGYPAFYVYHMVIISRFYKKILGVPEGKFRFLEKGGEDKAFYNKIHMDIEVNVESWGGFKEVGGLHYRGDYDLTSHTKGSNKSMLVKSDGREFMPHVLELSFGVDRNLWAQIDLFFTKSDDRQVLSLKPYVAPYSAAVLPLQNDASINKRAMELFLQLSRKFRIFYDSSGSIGKRYARMDEIGTPYCITIDYDTVDSQSQNFSTATVRKRDSREQDRVKLSELENYLQSSLNVEFD